MEQIKNENGFSSSERLGLTLIQFIYSLSEIMCKLKEVFCMHENANLYYGDNYRNTTIPAYCGCKQRDCKINPVVKKYKNKVQEFKRLWTNMEYLMLL